MNWKDANGVELSVDNLIDSQTYYAQWIDDIKPALSVQVTANVAAKQTATITATDAGTGVAAYYIGKQNPEKASVNFTSSTAGTFTGEITSDSTWYFAVKDAAGNMQVSSKDFCKVMFGLASGETISPSTIVIEKGKQVTLPNPSKAGYSFKGWSNVQNPNIANISTFFTKVKVDNSMTVYPCFVDDIAPVLTVNAATGGIGSSGTISITNATEQGSGIAGYYIGQTKPNASGSNVTFGATTSVTVNNSGAWYVAAKDKAGNLSVVQSFAYYQLTLNADGATNYTSNSAFIKSGTTVALPTGLTKTGYKADTWTGGISSITVSGNGSLSPVWNAISYKIYFNSNGGTVSESSRAVKYGSKLGNLPMASRAGYQFAGWFTNTGNQVTSSTIMSASNLDLYAHWTQTDYSGPALSVSSSVSGVLYQGGAYGVFNYTFADSGSGIYGYYWGTTYPTATNVSYTKYSGSSISLTNSGGTYYFAVMDNCGNISISTSKCQKGSYGGSGGSQTIYTSGYRYFTASGNNHGGFGISDNNGTTIAYGKANGGCSFDCSSYLYLRAESDQGMYYIMIN